MDKQDKSSADGKSNSPIVAAIFHILRPLVRLLLLNGVTFPAFTDQIRLTYVKIAEDEFKLDSKPQTDSRISLITGIHRREVNRLRKEQAAKVSLSQRASMSGLLLTIWTGHAEYLDENGAPRALPRWAKDSAGVSFESMVQSVSKNIRARAVLDEWLRQGLITLEQDDKVHLRADAFNKPQDMEEKIYYFSQNIHDHLASTVHNLTSAEPPFLEQCVFYDRLSAESVKELRDYSRHVGTGALRAFNKRAAELQKSDKLKPDALQRINFGVYNFSELEALDEEQTS
jgi:general stress protein 26